MRVASLALMTLCLTIAIAVGEPAPRCVSGPDPPQAGRDAGSSRARYFALLDMYEKGDADAAVAECARLDKRDLPNPTAFRTLAVGRLRAVALLHIEALLASPLTDGHTSIVRAALTAMRDSDPAFARSATIVFAGELLLYRLPPADLLGLPDEKTHPEILLLGGSIVEAKAVEKLQSGPDSFGEPESFSRQGADPLADTRSPRESARGMLAYAEWQYRLALKADPHLDEARLRLGRVLQLENRRADAKSEFDKVAAETPEPFLKYLAALFRGQAEEQEGRYDAAIEAYAAALGEYPNAQAASLGLAHARETKGEGDVAWAGVRTMLRGSEEPQPDPWTVYSFAQYWQNVRRIAELRKVVRR